MELSLSIIAFRNDVRVCLSTDVLGERLSSRTSCTVTLTKGKRRYLPFYYTELVALKSVRKVICLNEFASSLSIVHLLSCTAFPFAFFIHD